MKTEAQLLGFHRDTKLPRIPEGMIIAKFHGDPVAIPARRRGEPRVNFQFTQRQIDTLTEYEKSRIAKKCEESKQ